MNSSYRLFHSLSRQPPELSDKGTKEFLVEIFRHNIGSHEFLALYLVCGVAAGLFAMLFSIDRAVAIIGASGALFAVMLTFATLYPDSVIYAFWFVPMRAPLAVLIFAGIAVFGTMTGFSPGVSHLTHLGGLIAGFLYVWLRLGRNPLDAFFRR